MNSRKITFFIFLICYINLFSQGLYIIGNDSFIDERTSYNVFDKTEPVFKNSLCLNFDMAPMSMNGDHRIGYIMRMKDKNLGTTYNILYNDQGESTVFKLNLEGKDVIISAALDKDKLRERLWVNIKLEFDLIGDSVHMEINGNRFSAGNLTLNDTWKLALYFGRSEHVIDIPPMAINNLFVGNDKKKYSFPLNESEGETVHDCKGNAVGQVVNPIWMINKAYYWNKKHFFRSTTAGGYNFNDKTQEIYYFNMDSITIYDIAKKAVRKYAYKNECPLAMYLGTNFIDNVNRYLYVYEVADTPSGDVKIARMSLDSYEWEVVSRERLPIQLHHHSSYWDEANHRYIIFGGFGYMRYSNIFYSFDTENKQWEEIRFWGDNITPRYFTSMGNPENSRELYLFGGMGNESGDQTVGRIYYYELYKVNLESGMIKKLWQIPWAEENVVPVRGMVIDNNYFYTLCYPEHFSNSTLKLHRFSVEDGSHTILGDSLLISSEKIRTNANLYYNKPSGELLAIEQEFKTDNPESTLKIFSLQFPPVTHKELKFYSETQDNLYRKWIISLIAFVAVIALAFYTTKKYRQKGRQTHTDKSELTDRKIILKGQPAIAPPPNSLCLFGPFSITSRNERDISYMMSKKLKQAFLLILYYSIEEGIASQEFSEYLWPDKSYDKAKNSRGVTLNNLRKILGEMDGINLIHENGKYKIVFTEGFYCDYLRCLEIVTANNTEEDMDEFVSIISRGKFLKSENSPILDSFKEYIENKTESLIYLYLERNFSAGNYAKTVSLSENVFYIDPLNEEALHYMIKSLLKLDMKEEAKYRYHLFIAEYKKTMGEEYGESFNDLLK